MLCEARVKFFKKLLISSTAMFLAVPALPGLADSFESQSSNKGFLVAQNTESDSDTLKITVTGTRSPRTIQSFPGSIEVIEKDDIDSKNTSSMIDILGDVPGVSFENIYSSKSGYKESYNGGNINIRGVDGNRVLMMVDGIRLPEQYFYGDYYTLGRGNYINFETLKAVEITKGPASSLYGSDALGGLVYFRSLEPGDLLEPGKNISVEVPASYNSANYGFSESIKLATRFSDQASGLFIFSREDASETQVLADDKYIDDEEYTANNFFTNIEFDLNDNSKINLVAELIDRESSSDLNSGNLSAISSPASGWSSATTYTEKKTDTKTIRDRFSLAYNYKSPNPDNILGEAKASVFSQYSNIEDHWSRVNNKVISDNDYNLENESFGGDIQLKSEIIDAGGVNHAFTYGVEYSEFETSRLQITNNTFSTSSYYWPLGITQAKYQPDTNTTRLGVYLQDEFSSGKFDFIAGVRYDNYDLDAKPDAIYNNSGNNATAADISSDAFSPSLAATYNLNPNLATYAKYSRGFRAPSYMEVNSSRNPVNSYTTLSNADLKPETSDTFEIGIKHSSRKNTLAISTFLSKYDDFIEAYKLIGTDSTGNIYQSQNASKAEIKGLEISSEYFVNEDRYGTSFGSSLVWARGDNTTDEVPLETVQPFEAKLAIRHRTKNDKWNSEFSSKLVGEQRVVDGTTSFVPEGYATFDIKTGYKPSDRLELNAGIYNLANKRYYNYQSVKGLDSSKENLERYSQPSRNFRLGFNYKF